MRFCTKTEGEHGFPYLLPTLMTLRNTFHPENPRSSIGAKVEISRFAVGELVNISALIPLFAPPSQLACSNPTRHDIGQIPSILIDEEIFIASSISTGPARREISDFADRRRMTLYIAAGRPETAGECPFTNS